MSLARSASQSAMTSSHVVGGCVMPASAISVLLVTHGMPSRYSGMAQTLPS